MSNVTRARRTSRGLRTSGWGVYRRPSMVPYTRRTIGRHGYIPSAITQQKSDTDTFTFSISENQTRETGPTSGTRVSPPLAVGAGKIAGSKITWDATVPPGGTLLVETSIDNGATWQAATSGYPIPRLKKGTSTVRAVLSRISMTRILGSDPSPQVHSLDVIVDVDNSAVEWTQLGVFDLETVDIKDGPNGVEIDIAGSDISARIARNRWEKVFTIPSGTNMGTAIMLAIANRYPAAQFDFSSTNVVTTYVITFGISDTDPWTDIQKMADACGMEVYPNAYGTFIMRPYPDPDVQPSVWTFTEDQDATITEVTRSISSLNVKNYIIVTGESSADGSPPVRGVAYDNDPASPTYILGPMGKRVYQIQSSLVTTANQAVTMAQALLRQMSRASEALDISTMPIPFLEPSDVIGVTREASKITGRFLIDSMTIPLSAEDTERIVARRQRESDGVGEGHIGDTAPNTGDPGGSGDNISYPYQIWAGFGSCINASGSDSFTALKNVHTGIHALDYMFLLGDTWYDDGSSGHVAHWQAKFNESRLKALIATGIKFVVIWSDHDFGFAQNATAGSITSLANSQYRTQFPGLDLPAVGIYRTWTDRRVRFIALDERSFKSPNAQGDNASKTILGSTQTAWLKNLLASDDYPVIVLIGDTQWVGNVEAGSDTWYGYNTHRLDISLACYNSPAKAVLRLEGDSHMLGWADSSSAGGIDRVYHAAPFYNDTKVKQSGTGWRATYPSNANEGPPMSAYGLLAIVDDGSNIGMYFGGYTADGVQRVGDGWSVSAPSASGGGDTFPNVGARLKIGSTTGYNHFNIGIGFASGDFDGDHTDFSQSSIAGGLVKAGYFEMSADSKRARLTTHVNGHTTPGSNYARVEFRELELDGTTNKAFNPDSGEHYVKVRGRVLQLAPNKPQLIIAQYHDGSDDTAKIYVDGTTVTGRIGDNVVVTLTTNLVGGQDYDYGIAVSGSGSQSVIKFYWNDFTTPKYTSSSANRSSNWYTKFGCYGQANTSTDSSSAKFIVELTKAECWHTGYPTPVGFS